MHTTLPNVLFLCTGNSCRSQMAEGFARALRADRFNAYSAGTNPHGMNVLAIRAMAEVGIDISTHSSKRPQDVKQSINQSIKPNINQSINQVINQSITQTLGVDFDFVVTVCDSAHESCPIFVGCDGKSHARIVHRGFDDPPRLANLARLASEANLANSAFTDDAMPHYRRVRDEIHAYILTLPESLTS